MESNEKLIEKEQQLLSDLKEIRAKISEIRYKENFIEESKQVGKCYIDNGYPDGLVKCYFVHSINENLQLSALDIYYATDVNSLYSIISTERNFNLYSGNPDDPNDYTEISMEEFMHHYYEAQKRIDIIFRRRCANPELDDPHAT